MISAIAAFDLKETDGSTAGDVTAYAPADDAESFSANDRPELLDNPAKRQRMSEAGRRRAPRALGWEHSERALLTAYTRAHFRKRASQPTLPRQVDERAHSTRPGRICTHRPRQPSRASARRRCLERWRIRCLTGLAPARGRRPGAAADAVGIRPFTNGTVGKPGAIPDVRRAIEVADHHARRRSSVDSEELTCAGSSSAAAAPGAGRRLCPPALLATSPRSCP